MRQLFCQNKKKLYVLVNQYFLPYATRCLDLFLEKLDHWNSQKYFLGTVQNLMLKFNKITVYNNVKIYDIDFMKKMENLNLCLV